MRSLRQELKSPGASNATATGHKPLIAMMPKAKGDPYFVSCKQGADEVHLTVGLPVLLTAGSFFFQG